MITYNSKMRARARDERKGLFAVGVDTPSNNLVYETPLEVATARKLFAFCTLVIEETPPREALERAFFE